MSLESVLSISLGRFFVMNCLDKKKPAKFGLQAIKSFDKQCARRETRTLKDLTPTASETATFTNFAIRALKILDIRSVATNVALFLK